MQRIRAWILGALVLALTCLTSAPPRAAELPLTLLVRSETDLERAIPLAQGGAATLSAGRIDRFAPDGTRAAGVAAETGQTLSLADDGAGYGILTHREGAADFSPTATFELRDPSGACVWSIGPTDDIGCAISSAGTVVGVSVNINAAERNALHFYGPDGSLSAAVTVPYLLGGRFTPEGNMFFAESAREGLIAFDRAGTELWRRPETRLFDATPAGERVALISGEQLEVLIGGQPVATQELTGLLARRIAISPDGERVAVVSRDELRVFDARTLNLLWQASIDGERFAFTSVDLASDDGWLLAGVAHDLGGRVSIEARHPNGEVRAYDASGRLCHQATLTFETWNIFTPTALLDASGKSATITTRRAVYRTVLP
jgi:hypothetical protein